jgi:hypothetical protein
LTGALATSAPKNPTPMVSAWTCPPLGLATHVAARMALHGTLAAAQVGWNALWTLL